MNQRTPMKRIALSPASAPVVVNGCASTPASSATVLSVANLAAVGGAALDPRLGLDARTN